MAALYKGAGVVPFFMEVIMPKPSLQFIIFAFFRYIVDKLGIEHYEFKINVNAKNEKIHVMITRKLCEDQRQSKMDIETLAKSIE